MNEEQTMNHTLIKTPKGERMILISEADFEAMQDAADAAAHERTMAEIAAGMQEWLTSEEVDAALAEPTPLAFWRKKRGLAQKELAKTVGISPSYLSGLESGARKGDPQLFLRLSRALRVRMEDIVIDG
jgi:DNA-binding XRE family transcriptional regulator/PHD/YefM family antitoxin component YafN of YafNO toxin-antitoxin module